jgi:anti-sigma-K factor RskA
VSAREDIAAYLLGELDEREQLAFEREVARDPELREEVERLRPVVERLHALDETAWRPAPAPPLRLPDAPTRTHRPRRLVLRPAVAALAAVVLLLAGLGAGLVIEGGDDDSGRAVALRPVAGGDAHGEARLASRTATVRLAGLEPSARGQFYELWLLNSADDLVALGSFRVPESGDAEVTVPVPGDAGGYRFVDLSVEPDDGNPSHSGDSVLRGRVPGA